MSEEEKDLIIKEVIEKLVDNYWGEDEYGEYIHSELDYDFKERIKKVSSEKVTKVVEKRVEELYNRDIAGMNNLIINTITEVLPYATLQALTNKITLGINQDNYKKDILLSSRVKEEIREMLNYDY